MNKDTFYAETQKLTHALFETTLKSPSVTDDQYPLMLVASGADFLAKAMAATISTANIDTKEFVQDTLQAVVNLTDEALKDIDDATDEDFQEAREKAAEIVADALNSVTKH